MAQVQIDRILETCCQRGGSQLVLKVGSPPFIRIEDQWRTMQAPELSADTIKAITTLLLSQEVLEGDGPCKEKTLAYGQGARFFLEFLITTAPILSCSSSGLAKPARNSVPYGLPTA